MSTDNDRYDRQLRLWGPHGQRKLSNASLCCFGSSALACEILKNLILPGIGSFVIVDETRVTDRDLGQNYFIPSPECEGEYRGKVVLDTLLSLNPSCKGSFEKSAIYLNDRFDVCIMTQSQSSDVDIQRIASCAKYVIRAQSTGFVGSMTWNSNGPHLILEAKSEEGRIDDYRISRPWPELLKFTEEAFEEDVYHVPYFAILIKALILKRELGSSGTLADTIKQLAPANMLNELSNFREALGSTYHITALVEDDVIVDELKTIASTYTGDKHLNIVLKSILTFYDENSVLPLHGSSLPDMSSSTHMYTRLCEIYRDKAKSDFEQIANRAPGIDSEYIKTVIANIRNIQVVERIGNIGVVEEFENSDDRDLFDFFETGVVSDSEMGHELTRYKETRCELHNVSAIIGAAAAQEIVKLVTNQFVPLRRGFIFNGMNGSGFTYG